MIQRLMELELARAEAAPAFVMVTVDLDDGSVVHATGPFGQPEQALAQAGRDDAAWKAYAEPGEGAFAYVVVPLWEADA